MGGRGAGSGGGSGRSFERAARELNPNATPEQVRAFTEGMQRIESQQRERTQELRTRARSAIGRGVYNDESTIADSIGFSYVERTGPNSFTGYHQGNIATITTSPSATQGFVRIDDVQVSRAR